MKPTIGLSQIRIILAIILLSALSCCAGIPSIEKMKVETSSFNLPKQNDGHDVLVYVVRPSKFGGIVKFDVFVDGKEDASEVGYNRGKKFIYFFVKPGQHTIFSKSENTAEIAINGKAGETIFIKQDASVGAVLIRNSLQIITETEGKYYIKNSALGTINKEKSY